jgi:glycosyltransferase involved in cell wall biosynthesis
MLSPHDSPKDRLRVGLNAHLLSLRESYRSAGVSRYVRSLLTYLPQMDDRLDYLAFCGDARVQPAGWRTRLSPWNTEHPVTRILWEQVVQPWGAWREKLDLLHAPVYVGPVLAPCPIVVTVHDLSHFLYSGLFRPLNRAYLQALTRWTVSHAAHVISDSQSTRSDITRILGVPESRITVVYPGVDEGMHPIGDRAEIESFRARRGLPEKMILFVGTLEPRKNVLTLLEAYALLRRDRRFAHRLVIAGGKGWYYERIFARAEQLGLRDEVIFPDYVPQEELVLWYNAADVFVYPSLYEGFGLPPLEAMACGTPVVVSGSSSLPEVVGDAGVAVEARDAEALAQAIAELVQDRGRHGLLREAGLARARGFSWRATARETARLYHCILGDGQADGS